MFLEAIESFKI